MRRKALLLYAFKALYAGLTLGLAAAVARLWGVESFGRFSLLWTVLVVATVMGGAGTGSYLIELLPKLAARQYSLTVRRLSLITLAVSALITLPTFAVLQSLATYAIAATAVIPASLHSAFVGALVAEGRQLASGAIDGVLRPGTTLAITIAMGTSGSGPAVAVTCGLVVGYATSGLLAAWLARAPAPGTEGHDVRHGTGTVTFARPLATYVMVGALTVLLAQADRFVFDWLGTLRDVATYSAAQNTSNIVVYAVNSAAVLVLPQIAAHLAGRTGREELVVTMDRLCRPLVAGSLAAALVAALLGDRVLRLFGPEFADGQWSLVILLLGLAGSLMFGFPISVVTMSDHRLWLLAYMAAGVMALVGLSALMLPMAGAAGVAAANACVSVGVRAALHLHCRRAGLPSYFAVRLVRS